MGNLEGEVGIRSLKYKRRSADASGSNLFVWLGSLGDLGLVSSLSFESCFRKNEEARECWCCLCSRVLHLFCVRDDLEQLNNPK